MTTKPATTAPPPGRETVGTTLVIPTIGRRSLTDLLEALASGTGPVPEAVVVVDDRRSGDPLVLPDAIRRWPAVQVVRSGGDGPAAARNRGWREATTEWVSFVDDDVLPAKDWLDQLADDLDGAADDVAAVQGRLEVPLPTDRRPRDFERSTAGLATAPWITADMSYRRRVLAAVGGFDERFRRAYREDSDLALRALAHGRITDGERLVRHPVRTEDDWVSLRQQRGNADDALMGALHGRHWRVACGASRGRFPRHVAIVAGAVAAVTASVTGHRRVAVAGAAAWAVGTVELAWARIAPGPRDAAEVRRMVLTSIAIPPAALSWSVRGRLRHRRAAPWVGVPELVLFDRDGTLVHDVPYNGDPDLVRPVGGAQQALALLRTSGVRTGVVTNQSAVGSGRITTEQMDSVNSRVNDLLGPFDVWESCPHTPDDGCECRKPAPGMVLAACKRLGVDPRRCVVIGDIGADITAAQSAGATGVLVPNDRTRVEEVAVAPLVQPDLGAAVRAVLAGAPGATP